MSPLFLVPGLPRCRRIPKALPVTVCEAVYRVERSRHPDDQLRLLCGCGLYYMRGRQAAHERSDCNLLRTVR